MIPSPVLVTSVALTLRTTHNGGRVELAVADIMNARTPLRYVYSWCDDDVVDV